MDRTELIEKLNAMMQQTVENGCTPDEADNAARMLGALLVKYNLSLGEVKDVQTDDDKMTYDAPLDQTANGQNRYYMYGSAPEYLHHLAASVGRLNFCEVVGNDHAIYLGAKRDVDLAVYMFETLMRQIRQQAVVEHRAWVKERWGGPQPRETIYGKNHPRVWRESWVDGACDALASKFWHEVWNRDHKENDAPTTALVVNKRAAAVEYAKTIFPVWYGLKPPSRPPKDKDEEEKKRFRHHNGEAWHRGYRAGQSMSPTRGVESGNHLGKLKGD